MSDVADKASVHVLLSDYAAGDAAGKLNILGGGIQLVGHDATAGVTAPFSVVALASFAPEHVGESPAVELLLEDDSGTAVKLPGPVGPMGEPQTMSIAQAHTIEEPIYQGAHVPRRLLRSQMQMVLNFATGLPLAVGALYRWRFKIDHFSREEWTTSFYVPGPPPAPVFGGGTGPSSLPFGPPA